MTVKTFLGKSLFFTANGAEYLIPWGAYTVSKGAGVEGDYLLIQHKGVGKYPEAFMLQSDGTWIDENDEDETEWRLELL